MVSWATDGLVNWVISIDLKRKKVIVMNLMHKETTPPSEVKAFGLPPRLKGAGPPPN